MQTLGLFERTFSNLFSFSTGSQRLCRGPPLRPLRQPRPAAHPLDPERPGRSARAVEAPGPACKRRRTSECTALPGTACAICGRVGGSCRASCEAAETGLVGRARTAGVQLYVLSSFCLVMIVCWFSLTSSFVSPVLAMIGFAYRLSGGVGDRIRERRT